MPDQEFIDALYAQLAVHRRTLAHLLHQAAQHGGVSFAPPATVNGMAEARAEIAFIKATLRDSGAVVDDEPNDLASLVDPTQPALARWHQNPQPQSPVTSIAVRNGSTVVHRNRRGDPRDRPRCTAVIAVWVITRIAPTSALIVGFGVRMLGRYATRYGECYAHWARGVARAPAGRGGIWADVDAAAHMVVARCSAV
jgi:hypothetical protein